MNRRARIAILLYQQSRRAWSRWRLSGMRFTKMPGYIEMSRAIMQAIDNDIRRDEEITRLLAQPSTADLNAKPGPGVYFAVDARTLPKFLLR
jgi:hypothetical protein